MEEKKVHKRDYSLRSIFNNRYFIKSIFGRFNTSQNNFFFGFLTKSKGIKYPLKIASGFTLIELVVVILILSVLVTISIVTINPIKQIQKAKDAQRQHDLSQIRNSLDNYYNDTNCYPTSLTMGSQFSSGSTIYIQKVPQDPDFLNGYSDSYLYQTDKTQTCPQWNVLFAKLSSTEGVQTSCSLTQLTDSTGKQCVPVNYQSLGYNYCVLSGKVDCDYISANSLPPPLFATPIPTSIPTPTPVLTPTPIPTPTPTPTATPIPTPNPSCLCINTDRHISYSGQDCQGGGYSQRGQFTATAYFCPNGQTNNCHDLSQAATDCH